MTGKRPRPDTAAGKVSRLIGRAVSDYRMIRDRDRILTAVSGGWDSLFMLNALMHLRRRAPVDFELVPVYVDPGFDNGFARDLAAGIRQMGLELQVVSTEHGIQAHADHNRENPCFLCSRLRRKTLFERAEALGCTRIALGHHKDDIIETFFINMFFSGRLGTMVPRQPFFTGRQTVIRPLAYVEKKDIARQAEKNGLPRFENPCPSDGSTRRSEVRSLLRGLYREYPHIKSNIFRAMGNVKTAYLL